jgi:hypothetical protein
MKLSLIQDITYSNSVNQAMMEYTLQLVWVTRHKERVDSKFQFELMFSMTAAAKNTDPIQAHTYITHSNQSIWIEVSQSSSFSSVKPWH